MKAITVFIFAGVVIVVIATVIVLAGSMFWLKPSAPIASPAVELPPAEVAPAAPPAQPQQPDPNQAGAPEPAPQSAEQPAPAEQPRNAADEELAARIRNVLFAPAMTDDLFEEVRLLRQSEPRLQAVLLEILRDKSLRAKLVSPTSDQPDADLPIQRACRILGSNPPASAIEPLALFLDDPSSIVRGEAAYVIAVTGNPAAVPHFERALKDKDDDVRSAMVEGLQEAVDQSRMGDATKAALFERTLALLKGGNPAEWAPALLYKLDPQKAADYLVSDEVVSLDCKFLMPALRVVLLNKVKAPRERLLPIIERLSRPDRDESESMLLGGCLYWLAQLKNPEDRPLFEKLMADSHEGVVTMASESLLHSQGIEGYDKRLSDKYFAEGFAALSPPQQQYLAVIELDGDVNSEGFKKYFAGENADHWRAALAGLEAMQMKDRLAAFRQALARFPNSSPDEDLTRRKQQLSGILTADEQAFRAFDEQFSGSKDFIDAFLTRFILQNVKDFKE